MPSPEPESLLEAGACGNLPETADSAEGRWQAAERQFDPELGLEQRRRPRPVGELGLVVFDEVGVVRDRDVIPVEGYPAARRHDQVRWSRVCVVIYRAPADGLLRLAPNDDGIGIAGSSGDRLGKALEIAHLDLAELEQEPLWRQFNAGDHPVFVDVDDLRHDDARLHRTRDGEGASRAHDVVSRNGIFRGPDSWSALTAR